jgi:hypothetical protein
VPLQSELDASSEKYLVDGAIQFALQKLAREKIFLTRYPRRSRAVLI